jgi:hypothetical protein
MEFAEFYEAARDDCLRAVHASVGDRHTRVLTSIAELPGVL